MNYRLSQATSVFRRVYNSHYTENDAYKTEPSGGKLQERNSKWLNDDYVKFIRFSRDSD